MMKNNNFKTRTRVLVTVETINGEERTVMATVVMNYGNQEIKTNHNLRNMSEQEAKEYVLMLSMNALDLHYITEMIVA